MGGGLMQLVAYGAQDVYITGNPQITHFKNVYQRHTNFSIEPINNSFDGNLNFGNEINCKLDRNGDLISKMYLQVKLRENNTKSFGYVKNLGYALIDEISVMLGGETIDRHYGKWLNIEHQLSNDIGQNDGFDKMIGNVPELLDMNKNHPNYTLYIPLKFWFNKNYGLSLPVIALQHNDINIKLKLRNANDIINYKGETIPSSLPEIEDITLITEYIFLDKDERQKFAEFEHEYLIEQLQHEDEPMRNFSNQFDIILSNPVKYLVWTCQLDKYTNKSTFLHYHHNNNTMYNNFAKIIWLASRKELSDDGLTVDLSNLSLVGSSPEINEDGNVKLYNLGNKVKGYMLFTDSSGNGEAILDNVFILENNLTSEDMSITVDELLNDSSTTTAQTNIINNFKTTIVDYSNFSNYLDNTSNPVIDSQLKLNGHNRFAKKDGHYFNYVQPYQHFKNTPSDGINVYSFALNPLEHQPSGTCNFSRIDSAVLDITLGKNNNNDKGIHFNKNIKNALFEIYGVNYNVLKIKSGVGGVAYN